MAKVTSRKHDPVRKLEIVTIEDEFGARMIVQHPLTLIGYDFDAEEQKAIELMELNATTYRTHVERRNALLQNTDNAGGDNAAPSPGSGA